MSGLTDGLAIKIRQMILNGEFSPGDRLTEVPLAKALGVSRTPTRAALSQVEQDGLLLQSVTGGYTVRAFTLDEIRDAIDVRGTLEGLAAELIALRGPSRPLLQELKECLRQGDELVETGSLRPDQFEIFVDINQRFHAAIIEESGNQALKRALEINDAHPFSAARMAVFDSKTNNFRRLVVSQSHHHAIVQALEACDSGRARALMREHSNLAKQTLTVLLERRGSIPGAHLVAAQ